MSLSLRNLIFLILAMLCASLAWKYYWALNQKSVTTVQLKECGPTTGNTDVTAKPNNKINTLNPFEPKPTHVQVEVEVNSALSGNDTSHNPTQDPNAPSPMNSRTDFEDITLEQSQAIAYQQALDRQYYFDESPERKEEIIETLSPQGGDLVLLSKIVEGEDPNHIKIKALTRLTSTNNFVATQTLLNALENPANEIVATALNSIVTNGDRSLLPLLKDKMKQTTNETLRSQYQQSIKKLEYSVSMGMDNMDSEP